MDFFYLLDILFFSFSVVQGTAKYSISQKDVSSCTLATPPIYFTENGTYLNLSKVDILDISVAVKQNATFRVGYVQQNVIFVYTGCALSSEIYSMKHDVLKNNVGRCYTRCGTDIVGLQANTCHCISGMPQNTSLFQGCWNAQCSLKNGDMCGNSNKVLLYMKVRSSSFLMHRQIQDNGGGNCLAFAQGNDWSMYYWAKCDIPYKVVCQKGEQIDNTLRSLSWFEALKMCLTRKSLLVYDMNSTHKLPSTGGQLWTGYIRNLSIIPLTDGTFKTEIFLPGYVRFVHDDFKVFFSDQNENVDSLCNTARTANGHSLPRTKAALQIYTSSATGHMKTDSVPTAANQSTMPNSLEQVSTPHSVNPYTGVSEVILYTVIPVLSLIILGTVGIILWRRRSFPFCRQQESDFDENISTTTANTKLESEPNSEAQQHDYFVLEPQGNYDSLKYIKEHDRTEDNCDRASSFTYNHALSVTYNSAKDFKEDDYDTTISVSKPLGFACAMSSFYDRLDNSDTYNHIGDVTGITAKTDDTYNHLEQKKSEMYDTTSTVSKPVIVVDYGDDIYSKVLKKK